MRFKRPVAAAAALFFSISLTTNAFAGSKAFDDYGKGASIGIPVAAGLISLIKHDNEGLLELGEGFALTMAATYGLKHTVHRMRPDGSDNQSFPSGHTSAAFAGASYLQFRYGWEYGVPAYVLAAAVGWSRVDAREHHWTDVIASAVIANISAVLLTDRFRGSPVRLGVMTGEDADRTYGVVAQMDF